VYHHGIMSDNNVCCPAKEGDVAVFGYEDFWATSYTQFGQQFDDLRELMQLAQEMVKAADKKATEPVEKLVCDFARVVMTGACEVIVLCGNGCGAGAMKVVRGMYETQWTAEYMRQNPSEVEDYIEFSKIIMRRKLDWLTENDPVAAARVSPEVTQQIEKEYQQVRGRFSDGRDRVRWLWSDKSIREIAKSIGREIEYELPYANACAIHHVNFEGLAAHLVQQEGELQFQPPPSTHWIAKALVAAYANLLKILGTLNGCCALGCDPQLKNAVDRFSMWSKSNVLGGDARGY
jgi:hypothetical protein